MQDHEHAGRGDDVPALHPGQPDQPDVLRETGVGEGVQHAADEGGQAVRAQRPGDILGADPLLHDLTGGEDVTGGLHRGDQHDHDHRDDRRGRELRDAEEERRGDAEPGGGGTLSKLASPRKKAHPGADDQTGQHRDGGHEALEDPLDDHDHGQRAHRVGQVLAAGRVGVGRRRRPRRVRRQAAARCR